MSEDFKHHLFLKNIHSAQEYTTPPGPPINYPLPKRNRKQHGNSVLSELKEIWKQHDKSSIERNDKGLPSKDGEYITFIGHEKQVLELDSLSSDGAKLLNVKTNNDFKQVATVYIPDGSKQKLISKIAHYISQDTKTGKPKNQKLVEKIDLILKTTVDFIWSGSIEYLPKTDPVWCELWLAIDESEANIELNKLLSSCEFLNIPISQGFTSFPERTIVTVKLNYEQLVELTLSFGRIAEIRRAEELNSFWLDQTVVERENWINSATSNITYASENNYISILDSGVNNGHLLLKDALLDTDRLTVDVNWGINDAGHNGHGTSMAGIALHGNLKQILESNNLVEIRHKLESIKVLPPNAQENEIEKCHYITQNAVNIAIINNPHYKRIFCMAITGKNQNDFGKPSTWSAYLDKIIFGDNNDDKKIFIVSAGNVREEGDWKNYPDSNFDLSIESPAQSWNAITIGAFTQNILPDLITVANKFELSPYSRTSSSWESLWPIKPEVVFEGGNLRKLDNGDIDFHEDLDILTTSTNASINAFARFNATSAATAFAANFIAKLRDKYPNAWPETLRALLIHSASWNNELIKQFKINTSKISDIQRMLRIVGYGIPNLEKAIQCQSNYLTFISEQVIQPYKSNGFKTNEIHYYDFPWPKEILENLGSEDVTLRVTLSYFIEPNPGDKGYSTKYSYQSCGLRFLLINPGESAENFKIRTNRINIEGLKTELGVEKLEEGDYIKGTGNSRWFLGADTVFKGSIHSNYWKGSAAEIASCNRLAIYPLASGWWKQLKKQQKADSKLRYSLIVSIETPENSQDIYTAIVNTLPVENLVQV